MSSLHHGNLRTSPHHTRKTAVKATRPAPLGAPKPSLKGNGKPKQSTDKPKEKDLKVPVQEDDDDMATSFLQFCVTCDRQILVPNNSLLYCSERCKRIDADHVTDYHTYTSLNSSTSSEEADADGLGCKKRPIVERAVPTPRPMLSARIPPVAHEGKSDLDPTEWKPKTIHHPTSDASKYLSQFHRTPPTYGNPRRPSPVHAGAIHAQSMTSVPMAAPSLSATPSASSTSSGDSIAGTPYDFANRPMTMDRRPTSAAIKSVDLVTPKKLSAYSVPTKPTTAVSETMGLSSDLSYEKKLRVFDCHGPGVGSLTTLLGAVSLERKTAM
ncbi:MAG: hypothetical protein Q9201_002645 [Fulgogasparrea decipioides]